MRMDEMDRALESLRKMYMQLDDKNDWQSLKDWVPAYNILRRMLNLRDLSDAANESQQIAAQAIRVLEGSEKSEKWGNAYSTALSDDYCFAAWCDLADTTGSTLSRALGFDWGIDTFVSRVSSDVAQNVSDVAKPTLAIAGGVFAIVLVILLLK